jgi:hypothetical protein
VKKREGCTGCGDEYECEYCAGYENGADEERARIVAWLRQPFQFLDNDACGLIADALARGAHEEKEG